MYWEKTSLLLPIGTDGPIDFFLELVQNNNNQLPDC